MTPVYSVIYIDPLITPPLDPDTLDQISKYSTLNNLLLLSSCTYSLWSIEIIRFCLFSQSTLKFCTHQVIIIKQLCFQPGLLFIKNHLIIGCHHIWKCCQLITYRVVPKWALCLYNMSFQVTVLCGDGPVVILWCLRMVYKLYAVNTKYLLPSHQPPTLAFIANYFLQNVRTNMNPEE